MLTKAEMRLASNLLKEASALFSNRGCNDTYVDNTDENWKIIKALEEWSGDSGLIHERPKFTKICVYDWLLMSYLSDRLKEESE